MASGVVAEAGVAGVSVELFGSGVRGGGELVGSGRRTVVVPPACFYRRFLSGAEYAAAWGPRGSLQQLVRHLPPEDAFTPWDGYQAHADDAEGRWYYPTCELDRFPSSVEYLTGYREFRAAHEVVFVPAGGPVPVAQVVPPVTLALLAFEHTDLPAGQVVWNPRRDVDASTFVGVDTWVWVDNPVVQVQVTAQIPGLSATVTSVFAELRVQAQGAQDVTCTGTPGTAWVQGAGGAEEAQGGCVVVFERSSAGRDVKDGQTGPTSTLTATARWRASWTSDAAPGVHELDDPQIITYPAEIPVAEIQTIVTA